MRQIISHLIFNALIAVNCSEYAMVLRKIDRCNTIIRRIFVKNTIIKQHFRVSNRFCNKNSARYYDDGCIALNLHRSIIEIGRLVVEIHRLLSSWSAKAYMKMTTTTTKIGHEKRY